MNETGMFSKGWNAGETDKARAALTVAHERLEIVCESLAAEDGVFDLTDLRLALADTEAKKTTLAEWEQEDDV